MLQLALAPLAKSLELTLDSMAYASTEAVRGSPDNHETMETALSQPQAASLRPASQVAKLVHALLWLNHTAEACAITDLAVQEAVCKQARSIPIPTRFPEQF